jgi:hypothetical protein
LPRCSSADTERPLRTHLGRGIGPIKEKAFWELK